MFDAGLSFGFSLEERRRVRSIEKDIEETLDDEKDEESCLMKVTMPVLPEASVLESVSQGKLFRH